MADRRRQPEAGRVRQKNGDLPLQRTAEIARRRERRRRRLRLLGFLTLILALCLAAGYQFWLRDSSLVAIRNLEIVGVTVKNREGQQIKGAVELAVDQMTALHPRPELLDEELSRFPRVASARIDVSLPDSATVSVSLRENGSRFGHGADALLIATDGTVLGPAGDQAEELPQILTGDRPQGDRLAGRALTQALVLGGVPRELRSYLAESDLGEKGVEVTLANGLVLIFGDDTQVEQKWRSAAAVIADPNLEAASYVDLTVPRRPAVTGSEETDSGDEPVTEPPLEPDVGEPD